MELGRHELALLDFDEAMRRARDDADTHSHRGRALEALARYPEAAAEYRRAVDLRPADARLHNQLAWLLATCPSDDVRNGKDAQAHATRACELTNWTDATALDTLAAAHAECGDFAAALRHTERALGLASHDVAAEIALRLASFQDRRPWRSDRIGNDDSV
jgi:serine/threonine-protein kinase